MRVREGACVGAVRAGPHLTCARARGVGCEGGAELTCARARGVGCEGGIASDVCACARELAGACVGEVWAVRAGRSRRVRVCRLNWLLISDSGTELLDWEVKTKK